MVLINGENHLSKIYKVILVMFIGAATTMIASFAHADRVRLQDKPIYFGLLLAPLLLVVVQRWMMSIMKNRWTGFAFLLAWILISVIFAVPNGDGDIVLSNKWFTSVYLGISALLLSMSAVITPRRRAKMVMTE